MYVRNFVIYIVWYIPYAQQSDTKVVQNVVLIKVSFYFCLLSTVQWTLFKPRWNNLRLIYFKKPLVQLKKYIVYKWTNTMNILYYLYGGYFEREFHFRTEVKYLWSEQELWKSGQVGCVGKRVTNKLQIYNIIWVWLSLASGACQFYEHRLVDKAVTYHRIN